MNLVLRPSIVSTVLSAFSLDATLNRLSNVQLNWVLLARHDNLPASDISTTSRSLNVSTPTPSITTTTATLTSKMDMARDPSSISSTYTGPLDLLDNQAIFNNIFGSTPVILLVVALSSRAIEESGTLQLNS